MPIKVAIVEDQAGICEELAQIIAEAPDCSCVMTCRNLQTALRKIPPIVPDVVIMDISLPDGSGIEGVARLKRFLPQTQFLMFTISDDSEQIIKALEAGASGYLLKRTAPQELLSALREIKAGGVPMTDEVARKLIQSFQRKSPKLDESDHLTPREEEILELLTEGMLSKEIARKLEIGVQTVNTHLKNIYGKLHVRSRTEAVIKFLK